MNSTEYLLTCLAEEGSEITKDCCKALRFGLDDVNVLEPTGPDNRARICDELNDLFTIVKMLVEKGVLPEDWMDPAKMTAKREKVWKFMRYSHQRGALKLEAES